MYKTARLNNDVSWNKLLLQLMYIVAFKYGQNLCISLSASEALDDVDGAATGLRHRSRIMTCIIL